MYWKCSEIAAIGALLIGAFCGCGKGSGGPVVVPVSGTVALDGEPLEGAVVAFRSKQEIYVGTTDANGWYELKSGAAAGPYKVDISKRVGGVPGVPTMDPAAPAMPGKNIPESKPIRQLIPARYSNHKQTELAFTVVEPGTDSADFDLTTQ